ncbi:MAG: sigma-70 family RNA polymerase sigma factor [Bacteroidota bacterium]
MSSTFQPTNPRSDRDIIDAIKAGGRHKEYAIQWLMEEYGKFMHKIQKKYGLTEEGVQDAYTDAIIGLIQQIEKESFRGESKLSTFFYRIFSNKGVDLFRKNSTKRINTVVDMPPIEDPSKNILSLLDIEDEIQNLNGFLDNMGDNCKQILLDWGFWGYGMAEIAERAGLKNADQAKRQKYRCLQKLTKMIAAAQELE